MCDENKMSRRFYRLFSCSCGLGGASIISTMDNITSQCLIFDKKADILYMQVTILAFNLIISSFIKRENSGFTNQIVHVIYLQFFKNDLFPVNYFKTVDWKE